MTKPKNYKKTQIACYLGFITQAISANFTPLLFLTFKSTYGISLEKIALIPFVFYLTQLLVDFAATKFADRIGYRICVAASLVLSALGLVLMAFLPEIMPHPFTGILIAVVLYAIGSGLIEVLVSPIIEACPFENKDGMMSLLHSFYCWGHVAVVLLSTAFFRLAGIENWKIMACLWALIPAFNAVYYAKVPLYPITSEGYQIRFGGLIRNKVFWLVIVLMLCAGASEHAIAQWASSFAESALNLSKTAGDLLGVCAFAVLMGTARAFYGKYSEQIPLKKMMIFSAVLCICCYCLASFIASPVLGLLGCAVCGFSVGIFWPGTFSMAASALPGGGTAMYALMALAGDLGCSSGPTVVGLVADSFGGNLKKGIAAAMVFPIVMLVGISLMKYKKANSK